VPRPAIVAVEICAVAADGAAALLAGALAAVELELLVLLLELPHPASATVTSEPTRINVLFTGFLLSRSRAPPAEPATSPPRTDARAV
jgi:hypothetical protein